MLPLTPAMMMRISVSSRSAALVSGFRRFLDCISHLLPEGPPQPGEYGSRLGNLRSYALAPRLR